MLPVAVSFERALTRSSICVRFPLAAILLFRVGKLSFSFRKLSLSLLSETSFCLQELFHFGGSPGRGFPGRRSPGHGSPGLQVAGQRCKEQLSSALLSEA